MIIIILSLTVGIVCDRIQINLSIFVVLLVLFTQGGKKAANPPPETQQKASRIMETYLGEDPDSQEALEFLCLAEGGEVTHYEVLSAMTRYQE